MKKLLLSVLIILSGCASTDTYKASSELNETNAATVYLYRTDVFYHSANPEKPFFYLDDKLVAKLGTGSSVKFYVAPGEHTLVSKESILFLPGNESGRISGVFESGQTYYFRYSKDFTAISSIGPGFVMSDTSSLKQATQQQFFDKS